MLDLIDTHAHISFSQFDSDRAEVLARAWKLPLASIICIGSGEGIAGNESAIALASTDARIFAAVGIHPHDAGSVTPEWIERISTLLAHPRVVALGEIGLDYHYDHCSPDVQKDLFRKLVEIARDHDKPIIIHDREAHEDVWDIIEDCGGAELKVLFHCFSGDVAFARRVVDAGHMISIPGIVTFPKAIDLHAVVKELPIEHMVLESDCPYLAPEPYRGKRNEPAYLGRTAERVADLKGLNFEDVARITTINARRFFNLPDSKIYPKIAYRIRNALYLNVTNKCNLRCKFCPKFSDFEVKGHLLKLDREPTPAEVIEAVGDPMPYDEIVFCGYGESTRRLGLVKEVARRLKEKQAMRVRLNTDGLANLYHGRNIVPELIGLIDAMSISLNAPDAKSYAGLCVSKHGEAAYESLLEFIRSAKACIPEVIVSVVAVPGLDIDACQRKAAELGVPLRVREYMNVG